MKRPLHFSHTIIQQIIQPGDTVIDATVGNGNDTVFLAELVGATGKVYGFDIQSQAIENTKKKLEEQSLMSQTQLIHDGHERIGDYLLHNQTIKAAVFNLGYLPKGDKSIITLPDTTLSAIKQCLDRLEKSGLISIMVYFGHEGGEKERDAVLNFVKQLPQEEFTVYQYQIINQVNHPPFLLVIEKR